MFNLNDDRSTILSLTDQVAIVTGAAGGIGSAIAKVLGAHGAKVILLDLDSKESLLKDISQSMFDAKQTAHYEIADISNKKQIKNVLRKVTEKFKKIDILVNCASIHQHSLPIIKDEDGDWEKVIDVNLMGTLYTCQAVLPSMIKQNSGAIVTIASDSAFDVISGESTYGISKIGQTKLMAYLANEHPKSGVRFNSIAPGWVKTEATKEFWSNPNMLKEINESIPEGRIAEPIEIANVVLFLVSSLSSYVNGHCLVVDGGRISGIPA